MPPMATADKSGHEKEAIVLYNLSPEVEQALERLARENGTHPGAEAAKIIEKHIEETISGETD